MEQVDCVRCGETGQKLAKAPLPNELGQRILDSIDQSCWDQWLQYQTALINHYGLDVRDPEARQFLTANMEAFLFQKGDTEEIDTSQEGNVAW